MGPIWVYCITLHYVTVQDLGVRSRGSDLKDWFRAGVWGHAVMGLGGLGFRVLDLGGLGLRV